MLGRSDEIFGFIVGRVSYANCGLAYHVGGAIMIERPGLAATGFTLMLSVFLMAAGLVRIIVSSAHRFAQWGWVLLNGVMALVLGILIWRDLPASSLWVIGTFVGVELIFNGWSWVMLSLAARKLSDVTA